MQLYVCLYYKILIISLFFSTISFDFNSSKKIFNSGITFTVGKRLSFKCDDDCKGGSEYIEVDCKGGGGYVEVDCKGIVVYV